MSDATYFYAQIDSNNVVVVVSQLAGEMTEPYMIPIGENDKILTGDIYTNGTWTRLITERIDLNTVEDTSYRFDLELGDYVEISRISRNETVPVPEPSEIDVIGMQLVDKDIQIMELQASLASINTRLSQGGL